MKRITTTALALFFVLFANKAFAEEKKTVVWYNPTPLCSGKLERELLPPWRLYKNLQIGRIYFFRLKEDRFGSRRSESVFMGFQGSQGSPVFAGKSPFKEFPQNGSNWVLEPRNWKAEGGVYHYRLPSRRKQAVW